MTLANSGIPLGQWSGSDATEALHRTIRESNELTGRQNATMIRLTRWITALTVAIAMLTLVMAWPLVKTALGW
jgi:CHASE3 domain sensor protein